MGQRDDDNRLMPPNHDERKPLLFYKLMVASIVHDDKLKIPGKVVRRIEQELSIVVTVAVPDGRKWNMKLGKDGGKCWLGDGWVEFMKYYNVRVGFFLVFRYKGDSTFLVNIFNLSNAEIKYLPEPVGGSGRVGQEEGCSVSNGHFCGNGDAQKKLDSVKVKEKKLCLPAECQKSGNDDNEELASAQVTESKFQSVTIGLEAGNDCTQKMPCLASQGSADMASRSQQISGIIREILQSKLSELRSEILSQNMIDKSGPDEVQHEKQCSLRESEKLVNDCTLKRPVSEMNGRGKLCLVKKCMESGKDVTQKKSGSKNIEKGNPCLATSCTDPANYDTHKKSDLPPPGFVNSSQQTPGTCCVLSPQNDKGGVEKEAKPLGGVGSPGPFILVKDVTPGYYRANIMPFKDKKHSKIRKSKNPQPTTPGKDLSGFVVEKVNPLGKKELTSESEIHLSKIESNEPEVNSLTTAAKPQGISHMITMTDRGDNKKLPEPDKLYSKTQLPDNTVNKPPASQLNLHTPVKRKVEIKTAELLNDTVPTSVPSQQKVDITTADALNSISDTGKVQKKRKTVQLSAISNAPINPYCMIHMRFSYVQKKALLNIPANFASKYLQKSSGNVTLQNLEGKQWKVRIISTHYQSKLTTGWYQFVADNCLKEGDMCIFELLDSANTLLKVSFIRSPKNPPPADQEVLKL